jgi:hypothetical protein
VDDYRGDDAYTAADLVAAAEALFSERCPDAHGRRHPPPHTYTHHHALI